ncbi:MAG: protein TolQ [Desulfatibacillaceae bacterium]
MNVSDSEVIRLILNSGPMVRFVLFILFAMSVVCWAIIFTKVRQLRRARRENAEFMDYFWRSGDLSKAFAKAKQLVDSPVARSYRIAYMEMTKLAKSAESGNGGAASAFRTGTNVERALRRANQTELTRLSQWVPFLATIGNTAPFIGLFGTVWGIMSAFHGIGQMGTASLAVVAPGISEALVATAAGLFAAIPAVIAYNHFMNSARVADSQMKSFSDDFINIVEREVLSRKEA